MLEALKASSRVAHTLAEGSVPLEHSGSTVVVSHPDRVRMGILRGNKGHVELLRLAVLDVLRLDVEVDFVLDPSMAAPEPAAAAAPRTTPTAPPDASSRDSSGDVPPPTGGPSARERAAAVVAEEVAPDADDEVSVHDADADGDLSGLALVQRELGATVMTEYDNG